MYLPFAGELVILCAWYVR